MAAGFNARATPAGAKLRFQAINAVVPLGARVLAGGEIGVSRRLVRGARRTLQFRSGLIALRAGDGTIDFAYNAHTSGSVEALALDDRTLYVGGSMSRRSGTRIVPRRSQPGGRKLKPRRVPITATTSSPSRRPPATRADVPTGRQRRRRGDRAGGGGSTSGLVREVGGRRRDGLAR